MKKWYLDVLRSLLSAPTCPFGEREVIARVGEWAARLGLCVAADAAGNLLVRPRGARATDRPMFFAAHMDHPGFLARRQRGMEIEADFIGTVRPEYFPGAHVAFFRGMAVSAMSTTGVSPVEGRAARMDAGCHGCASKQPCGTRMNLSTAANSAAVAPMKPAAHPKPVVRLHTAAPKSHAFVEAVVLSARSAPAKTHLLCRLRLLEPATVPPGTIGMWLLPAMQVRGRRLSSRACDDVVGVASVLCALGEIVRADPKADVTGLLTVAEEAGLVGATAACEARTIPPGASVVAIETSAAQPQAKLGSGVVVRVGDRVWTFDPALTADIAAVAGDLAKKDRGFRFTRQLMPGGVCESTAYCLWGHQAAGVCVPLGNYHNQGKGNRIAAEQIDLGDFDSLVKLLVALPSSRKPVGSAGAEIRKRLADRLKAWRRVLSECQSSRDHVTRARI